MLRSLLLNFVELVGRMGVAPEQAQEKIEDVRDLFNNMHFLINQYRPHQARETLIKMMEEQVRKGRSEIDQVHNLRAKVAALIQSSDDGSGAHVDGTRSGMKEEDVEMTNGVDHHPLPKPENHRVWESVLSALNE